MRTIQATDSLVSIWISGEEEPDRAGMLALVRMALAERGLAPWAVTEAECFSAGADTLLIARPGRGVRLGFWFSDLEALLGGSLCCGGDDGALYASEDGGYILTVPGGQAAPALWEYGEPVPVSEDRARHMAEQGACLMPERALADLRRFFSR